MPDLRPTVATGQVLTLLNQHFHAPILDLVPLDGGQVARCDTSPYDALRMWAVPMAEKPCKEARQIRRVLH
jgi:hypothetical protein